MRLFAFLFTLALATLVAADNFATCRNKHPKAYQAIGKFCRKGDLVAPSGYSKGGANHQGARVWIGGGCNPPQWVPSGICFAQFYAMCAASARSRTYGNRNCQGWYISYANKKPAPKPKVWSDMQGGNQNIAGFKREADAEAEAEAKGDQMMAEAEM